MPLEKMKRIIVQRQTVDWLSREYSTQDSAESFAAATTRLGGPVSRSEVVSRIVGLIEFWNASFKIDFATCRQKLKQIAHASWQNVEHCDEICFEYDDTELANKYLGERVIALFTDDDDWYAPHVFSSLEIEDDQSIMAWLWRRTKFDGDVLSSEIGDPILAFTNNYAISGEYFPKNVAIKDILHHGYANSLFTKKLINYACYNNKVLSVTNKSPCSHNMILQAKNAKDPVESLLCKVEKYAETPLKLPAELAWAEHYCQEAQEFFCKVLHSRRR